MKRKNKMIEWYRNPVDGTGVIGSAPVVIFYSQSGEDLEAYIDFIAKDLDTFKNSGDLSKVVQSVPLNRILVETDSPYLTPEPFRGKSNEPSFIKYTIDKIAQIKNLSSEVISKETSNNFLRLFNLN